MKSKRSKKALTIILIIFAAALCITYIYLAEYLPARLVKPTPIITYDDYNKYESGFENYNPYLRMLTKKKISEGKYGFVKKFTMKEISFVSIGGGMVGSGYGTDKYKYGLYKSRNLVMGIYEDRKCNKPIDEYRILDNYKAVKAGKKDCKEHATAAVDPGTYYVGVYTTDKKDNYEVTVESIYGCIYSTESMVEGEPMLYYRGDDNKVNKFRIDAEKSGTVHLDIGYGDDYSVIRLLSGDGKLIKEFREPFVNENGELLNPDFKVEKGKTYYIEVHWRKDKKDFGGYWDHEYMEYNYIEPSVTKDDK